MNKQKKKLKQLGSYYLKLLKDDVTKYGVQSIYKCLFKHPPINMGIQSCLNTMHHDFTTYSKCQSKLIQ